MDYFKRLQELLRLEKKADRLSFEQDLVRLPLAERRTAGTAWYPIAIRDTELGHGDYLTIEVERTTHQDILHNFRFGSTVALFSNHDAMTDRIEGTLTHVGGDRLRISLRTDELPEWSRNGKLGVEAIFDENSYSEMEKALALAASRAEGKDGRLIRVLTGVEPPSFHPPQELPGNRDLNEKQVDALMLILSAQDLAIVHGPPGTGKTTTLVAAIRALRKQDEATVLVVAPSNAAVDLVSEKLASVGMNVVRVGNPARVSEGQLALTLDRRMSGHPRLKDIKRLKKQATEYRDMAHQYKRSFGPAEREQRKALFDEARAIAKEVDRIEDYITDDILSRADVITATLVGANHYSIRSRTYKTVVIDEAGQALEPACWIPILKADRVILAGDHLQLPPTIKSAEAAPELGRTLLEKAVATNPAAVVLLEEQYRMNDVIAGFSSQRFYKGRLRAHPSVANRVLAGEAPLHFIDTAGCGFEEKWEGTSLSNPEEAAFLIRQVSRLILSLQASASNEPTSLAIISPYKHQVEVLREAVRADPSLAGAADINTIDSFQGQERDAVFISLVRSNSEGRIGFLSDQRRMNVAMTRARKKLVIVGDSATLSVDAFYADLIAYAQERDAYQSAWELMEW
ncbi:MAG: helicase [Flaviaesturariibacter sp.]|nr:helicase [Flaviaesturariibacter sp.]